MKRVSILEAFCYANEVIKTEIQDTLGKSRDAYCLLALLSDDTKYKLKKLIKSLKQDLGETAWMMPEEALHITLCEIIQSKDYEQDKGILYSEHSFEYENIPTTILKDYKPISVSFNTIEASPQAIIIRGGDNGSFESIRKQLVERLPLPKETKLPPAIIHSTIARFRKEVNVEDVRRIVEKYSINIEEIVREFQLIHLHVTPLLNYDTIHTYRLG